MGIPVLKLGSGHPACHPAGGHSTVLNLEKQQVWKQEPFSQELPLLWGDGSPEEVKLGTELCLLRGGVKH